jgi:transcriptional regulator with XRE-family HTH domain|nr:MAG TPA: helix-turn-helix domain protein [Caudoviricetes sp.]
MFDKKVIAKKLIELRQKKQKTQQEVANAVGISVSAIAMYEAGDRVPRDEVKLALAQYYKTSVGHIFFSA